LILAQAALGAFLLGSSIAYGVILDRVVASVDYQAITESDLETEYRLEQFLDGKMPQAVPDDETHLRVRDRLIDQILLSGEASQSSNGKVTRERAEQDLAETAKQFGDQEAFASALQSVGLARDEVVERLQERDTILEMIDRRLRPEAWVESTEINTYYEKTFVPEYQKGNQGAAPPLSEVEGKIREILTQERINTLLEAWLLDLKTNHRVEVHTF